MEDLGRWALGLVVAAGIVALVLFGRGTPHRGEPAGSPAPSPAAIVLTA